MEQVRSSIDASQTECDQTKFESHAVSMYLCLADTVQTHSPSEVHKT